MKYPKQGGGGGGGGAILFVLLQFVLIHSSTSFTPNTFLFNILPENQLSFLTDTLVSSGGSLSHRKILRYHNNNGDQYCESWKYTVETNDANPWKTVPSKCVGFVKAYILANRYLSDSEAVAEAALEFAKSVNVSTDGKDAWVFDIDETLLSNVPYYSQHGYGSELYNDKLFNIWVVSGKAGPLPSSLGLYKQLKKLGFTIFLLTGRDENQRNITVQNLHRAGFTHWERLILRGASDHGKPASTYKSEKRKELEDQGYHIHGSSGDQWSDLTGFATAQRSFKLPNPLYFIG